MWVLQRGILIFLYYNYVFVCVCVRACVYTEVTYIFFFCQSSSKHFSLVPVGMTVLSTHVLGIILLSTPQVLSSLGLEFGFSTDTSVYMGYLVISLSLLVTPLFAGR